MQTIALALSWWACVGQAWRVRSSGDRRILRIGEAAYPIEASTKAEADALTPLGSLLTSSQFFTPPRSTGHRRQPGTDEGLIRRRGVDTTASSQFFTPPRSTGHRRQRGHRRQLRAPLSSVLLDVNSDEAPDDSVEFEIIPVPSQGNCLFDSVAQGECIAEGRELWNRKQQRAQGKLLRARAVEELKRRRAELEWALEDEDFNAYVRRMSRLGQWGGEMELLVLSDSLQRPIEVYTHNPYLRLIQTYGEQYSKTPVRVLFHGYGHIEALKPI